MVILFNEQVRQRQRSILRVDGRDEGSAMSPGKQYALSVSDFVYFGGYPGKHSYSEVTNKDFEGCIEDVLVERRPLDLTEAVETRSTIVGCPASYFAPSIATFSGNGYIQVDAADAPVSGKYIYFSITKPEFMKLLQQMKKYMLIKKFNSRSTSHRSG